MGDRCVFQLTRQCSGLTGDRVLKLSSVSRLMQCLTRRCTGLKVATGGVVESLAAGELGR